MFTNLCVIPIVDADNVVLILAADANPVSIQVDLLGAKTTDPTPTPPKKFETVTLQPYEVKRVRIDTAQHSEFAGGYGAVQLTSVTSNGQISAFVFSAWCSPAAPRDSNPASGSALVGGTFCIPFLSVGSGQTR